MSIKRINPQAIYDYIKKINSDEGGLKIMNKKGDIFAFHITSASLPAANILKQEALSVGGDFATPYECILGQKSHYDGVLIATKSQLEQIAKKCAIQPFGLKKIGKSISEHLKNNPQSPSNMEISSAIMAIINITPDSFFAPSRHSVHESIEKIHTLINKGIKLIDIGPASSRPGSELIEAQEEIDRLREIALYIKNEHLNEKVIFSIDTYNPATADFALFHGFKIINDVSGFAYPDMFKIAAKHHAKVILMHTQGTPKDMDQFTDYEDLFVHIDGFFAEKIDCLKSYGIDDIILDVGIGFAKNEVQNLALINHLKHFKHFGYPLLIGASRKSVIGSIVEKPPLERLSGTLAFHLIAFQNGADILRVHDVDEHIDCLKIYQSLKSANV
ncbi:dihydropteroate synthase [Helicobacter cappadocius]|uniref:dihydropteroate synthase n=1 Tax=Helicobacter cappadocius TaxID=3063998 RepID=A0AA90ST56_9HELI|nr:MULTISPECIES: dihydropteroate synthase [unclassified Helicobacter]MDO7253668.1 dihydropteroate synthase [Helicobacter sp. faydin-H75]MDP2539644.1 dihydropteroate synthase [Helicobacter sp. faydin-H76]